MLKSFVLCVTHAQEVIFAKLYAFKPEVVPDWLMRFSLVTR